ncbi:DNA repair protein [Rhodobacter lacus]|uniref:DNA repair protein n=1 Tax=Rhodobacter lacus TaxID=1641972 RepID=A0ABW5A9Y3_9RHOB
MSVSNVNHQAAARLAGLAQALVQGALLFFCAGALGLFAASALGLLPWLMLDLRLGERALPQAGAWLEGALALFALALLVYLPARRRVLALERSHRNFRISTADVAAAYRSVHAADRKGSFALSGEFDAMRERMDWMRRHPDLGALEPELLELAAQMSLQSRDLARIYSDEKVARARAFLEARQHEVDTATERLKVARATCDVL